MGQLNNRNKNLVRTLLLRWFTILFVIVGSFVVDAQVGVLFKRFHLVELTISDVQDEDQVRIFFLD